MSLINDMIRTSNGVSKKLLEELEKLNYKAYTQVIRLPGLTLKQKYHLLQKTGIWKDAKKILFEYFKLNNLLICPQCNKPVNWKGCVLHHLLPYNFREYFTPSKVSFVDFFCHGRIHRK